MPLVVPIYLEEQRTSSCSTITKVGWQKMGSVKHTPSANLTFDVDVDYEFPTTQSGKTFSHIFGANTNPLEHFLIQHDIMGPCWLNLEQCTKLGNDLSWCALNIGLDNPQCCSVVREERDAPPLNVMSLSLQTKMSRLGAQSNQVVAASFFLCKDGKLWKRFQQEICILTWPWYLQWTLIHWIIPPA